MTVYRDLTTRFLDCCDPKGATSSYSSSSISLPSNITSSINPHTITSRMKFLQGELEKLPQFKQTEQVNLFHKAFILACNNGITEAINAMITDKSYHVAGNMAIIYEGISAAIFQNHNSTAIQIIEHPSLDIRKMAEKQPTNNNFLHTNLQVFWQLCGARHLKDTVALEYMSNFIENNLSYDKNKRINLLTNNNYQALRISWGHGNEQAASFLIQRYGITGTEPDIVDYFEEADDNEEQPAEDVIERLSALMLINLEKQELEKTIGLVGQTDVHSSINAHIKKNHKI